MIQEYHKYHTDRENTRIGLYKAINQEFSIKKVLYLGSYTDITPSLVFDDVVYVDNAKQAKKFYQSIEYLEYINQFKEYPLESKIKFYLSDYNKTIDEKEQSFDLLISQYAGFVSKAGYNYLKQGGFLICNNSHGDADWARLSGKYKFIGVYNKITDTEYKISRTNLKNYFIPKKDIEITLKNIEEKNAGFAYTQSPTGYIFKKI